MYDLSSIRRSSSFNLEIAGIVLLFTITIGMGLSGLFSLSISLLISLIVLLPLLYKHVELIVLMIVVLVTVFNIPESSLLSLGFFALDLSPQELLLLFFLFVLIAKILLNKGDSFVKTPMDMPIFLFFSVGFFSFLYAIFFFSTPISSAGRGLSVFVYYLMFFVVTNLIHSKKQVIVLTKGLIIITLAISLLVVLSVIFGVRIEFLSGQVKELTIMGSYYKGVTRVFLHATYLMLVFLIVLACKLAFVNTTRKWITTGIQLVLILLGLFFSFTRSYMIALIFPFVLLIFFGNRRTRGRIVSYGLLLLLIGTLFFQSIDFFKKYTIAGLASFTSIESEVVTGRLAGRTDMNQYAMTVIKQHPVLGIGISTSYFRGKWQSFVHNGYLAVQLFMGIPGTVLLIWFFSLFLWRGFKKWRKIKDATFLLLVLGFTLSGIALLVTNLVANHFLDYRWACIIGVMMGINEKIYILEDIK